MLPYRINFFCTVFKTETGFKIFGDVLRYGDL